MFEVGTRVELKTKVIILGAYKESGDWLYRVKFENQNWSFIVSEKELQQIKICQYAPFPKCNNGEGCETCQFNEED